MQSDRRILIIKLSSLGDLFHALPAATNLREELGATLDWVTQPEYAGLVKCFKGVDRVITFPRRHFFQQAGSFIRTLRERDYDYIFDFQGLLKSAVVARWAKGKNRIGPSYAREGSRWLYHSVAGVMNKNRHAVDEAMDIIDYLHLKRHDITFPVSFPSHSLNEPRPRIALVPCSRWVTKNWPAENFIAVGRELQERLKARLFLVGAPNDRPVCEQICRRLPQPAINTCGQTSLVELGSLLQEMDLVITVDSGPMHMAAALGKPVIAVFGSTDPLRTGPYGQTDRVVTVPDLACRPCRARVCARKDLACLHQLTPEKVIQSAMKIAGQI
jgi:heptosyltransferase-1